MTGSDPTQDGMESFRKKGRFVMVHLNSVCVSIHDTLDPVSYTHLDVYKRQHPKNVMTSLEEK